GRARDQVVGKAIGHRRERAHRTRRDDHAGGTEAAAGERSADIAKAVHVVGKLVKSLARQPQLVLDGHHPRGGDHQMCFDPARFANDLQQPLCVHGAGGAGHPYDKPLGTAHSAASASFSAACSSPLWNISPMMSEPPMNSPLMYS